MPHATLNPHQARDEDCFSGAQLQEEAVTPQGPKCGKQQSCLWVRQPARKAYRDSSACC